MYGLVYLVERGNCVARPVGHSIEDRVRAYLAEADRVVGSGRRAVRPVGHSIHRVHDGSHSHNLNRNSNHIQSRIQNRIPNRIQSRRRIRDRSIVVADSHVADLCPDHLPAGLSKNDAKNAHKSNIISSILCDKFTSGSLHHRGR